MNPIAQSQVKSSSTSSFTSSTVNIVQRKCACGGSAGLSGECDECKKKKLVEEGTSLIQPKLKIGQPNDKYEQEADRVADEVMRLGDSEISDKKISLASKQTFADKCDGSPILSPSIQLEIDELQRSGGESLPASVRTFMEARLGGDLRSVRIHRNQKANKIAGYLHARAFTINNHIIFSKREFQSNENMNKRLVAHELVHTLQQGPCNQTILKRLPVDVSEETASLSETNNPENIEKRKERRARRRRVIGEAPPKTVSEAMSQLNIAKAASTVHPTDYEASTRILRQVNDWLYSLQTPANIDKHFSLRGVNKAFAAFMASEAYSEVNSLHEEVKRISRGNRDVPMPDGKWDKVLRVLQSAGPYLRTLAGEQTKNDQDLLQKTEEAGYIQGAVAFTMPVVLVPVVLSCLVGIVISEAIDKFFQALQELSSGEKISAKEKKCRAIISGITGCLAGVLGAVVYANILKSASISSGLNFIEKLIVWLLVRGALVPGIIVSSLAKLGCINKDRVESEAAKNKK